MANFFQDQIIMDSNKRTIIKSVAILDGSSQETANTKIIGMNLNGALAVDSNSAILVSAGGIPRTNYRANVARIIYDVNIPNGYLKLDFSGGNVSNIAICSGKFDMNMQENMGTIGNPLPGATGNILFTTVGAGPNNSYTVWMEIHKNGLDYNMGQLASPGGQARPNDFNFGPFGVKP